MKKLYGYLLLLVSLAAAVYGLKTKVWRDALISTNPAAHFGAILAAIAVVALIIIAISLADIIKINKLRNEGNGYRVFKMFVILFMLFIIALTLFPYLNVLAKAFNDSADAAKGGIKLWPRKFTLENFKQMLSDKNIYHALFITVARVVLVTIGALLVQFMTAYALTRKLKGTAIFNIFFLIPMFITGGTMASFVLYKYIGLLNNFWVYVLPGLFTFYNVIVIRSYIQTSIPESIIEAAHIDGISELGLFFRIILPLSKPILATVALWVMVANWNDWTTTLYFASRNKDLETLQYKLMQTIQKSAQLQKDIKAALIEGGDVEAAKKAASKNIPPETMKSTQIIIVTVPIILVYPFIQKYFTKGITLGAVKG